MNDLPTSASPQANQPVSTQPSVPMNPVGSSNKEAGVGGGLEVGLRDVSAQEVELPKEVASVGVKVQPTTIPIPPPVQQLGVQPTGQNVPVQQPPRRVPLTDDQIVQGLKQGVTTSWRWLAEYCVRRLKQLHHGVAKQPASIDASQGGKVTT